MHKARLVIVAVFAALLLGVAGTALAQTGGEVVEPNVESRVDRVSPQSQERGNDGGNDRGNLAMTGSDVMLFAIVGLGIVGAGSLIVARTRRRQEA